MKEYEIYYNNKVVGKVKLFLDNLKNDIQNSLIISDSNIKYNFVDYNKELQQYKVFFNINVIDDLYDIVKKYKYTELDIYSEIDKIKKYNNIKTIRKNTNIYIILSEIHLNNLNVSKKNIDKDSLLKSKIYFLKNTIDDKYIDNLNIVIKDYNNYKNSNEYEFLTDEEKDNNINNYLNIVGKMINDIENNTDYKYNKDFIIPIKINN